MESFLEKTIWGNPVEEWGTSILIILGTLILVKLLALFNRKVIRQITQKTSTHLDDIIYYAVESPILFGLVLVGSWIAISPLMEPGKAMTSISEAYKILATLNITWFFSRLINGLIEQYWGKRADKSKRTARHTERMLPIIKRSILIIIWVIGIAMALSNVGVNISALLGTLGIGGIAFALAAQDTVKNIFGGFTIFTDRPFTIGDTVRIDSFEGTVVDVGMRSTKIRDYDKRLITIPNYKIVDASIVNISAEPMRRVVSKLGLTYDTTPKKMNEAINILKEIPEQVKSVTAKDLKANFTDFSDSALVITFVYFIEKRADIQATTSEVNLKILELFNRSGINFAFPSQTVYIEGINKAEI